MKQLLILLFAKLFNRLKVSSPVLYGTVIAPALLWLQSKMFDPEALSFINSLVGYLPEIFPDQAGMITSIIKWLPTLILALTGSHTKEQLQTAREARRSARQLSKQSR